MLKRWLSCRTSDRAKTLPNLPIFEYLESKLTSPYHESVTRIQSQSNEAVLPRARSAADNLVRAIELLVDVLLLKELASCKTNP